MNACLQSLLRHLAVVACVLSPLSVAAAPGQSDLIAINVLIVPDQKMQAEASAWNARMRELIPQGFALGADHAPHITLLQRFIATSDLPKVLEAVDAIKARTDISQLVMNASGLYHIPAGGIGLAGIVIDTSSELVALQQAVIEAVNGYARTGGDEHAFVPDVSGAVFSPKLFKYVDTFVPGHTGENFHPHVTTGIAPIEWLKAQEALPFAKFSFGAVGIATYQLGNYGTAAKRLDRDR